MRVHAAVLCAAGLSGIASGVGVNVCHGAAAKASGGSGYSGTLSSNPSIRKQQLAADPDDPTRGSTSIIYDPNVVDLVGFKYGPGYGPTPGQRRGFVEIIRNNQPTLIDLDGFLANPDAGPETGFVQIFYTRTGQTGQIDPPQGHLLMDKGGVAGVDTHALEFQYRQGVPETAVANYQILASTQRPSGNQPDFLAGLNEQNQEFILGPSQLAPASVSGRMVPGNNVYLGATNNSWATPTNWSLGSEPVPRDEVFFPSPVPPTGSVVNLATGEVAHTLTFNDNYTLNGGTLRLSSGLDPNSGTIAVNIIGTTLNPATATIKSGMNWTGTVRKVGPGTLSFSLDNGPVTVAPGATLLISQGTVNVAGAVDVFTHNAGPGGGPHVNVRNGGTLNILQGARQIGLLVPAVQAVMSGQTRVSSFATLTADQIRQSELNIDPGASVVIHPGGVNLNADTRSHPGGANIVDNNRLNRLLIATEPNGSGKLNLNNNNLIIDYSPNQGSPRDLVRHVLTTGYAGGAWNGPGISTGFGNRGSFALGYVEAGNIYGVNGGTFAGEQVDGTALLVRFTRYGDANVSGGVDGADFSLLASSFGQSGKGWEGGDFNYSGVTDGADFSLLASNFGLSLSGEMLATPQDWAVLEAFGASIGVTVPEPSAPAVLLLSLAGTGLLRRRRSSAQ